MVMLNLDHAGYALQRLVGSENLAYFSIDCRDALDEVIRVFSARIREFVRMAIDAGVRGPLPVGGAGGLYPAASLP